MMTPWLNNPLDNSGVKIDILPVGFDPQYSNCTMCGGTLQTGWECGRCGADHWPAVERMLAKTAVTP
jgi:hypothetical protein